VVKGGFRERECGSEEGRARRGMIEREDEEGPDEGRWRSLNAFWAVVEGSRFFGGVLSLLGPEMETRAEDEEDEGVSSSGRIECLRLHRCWRGCSNWSWGAGVARGWLAGPRKQRPNPPNPAAR
jgi:hypothetical protein